MSLNSCSVQQPRAAAQRLHMLLHFTATVAILYYRITNLIHGDVPILPWVLMTVSEFIFSIWFLTQAFRWLEPSPFITSLMTTSCRKLTSSYARRTPVRSRRWRSWTRCCPPWDLITRRKNWRCICPTTVALRRRFMRWKKHVLLQRSGCRFVGSMGSRVGVQSGSFLAMDMTNCFLEVRSLKKMNTTWR